MVIFAISGSLREASTNTQILNLLKPLLPKNTEYITYQGLGKLPHYNSDLDQDNEPSEVKELRGMINRSQVVIISTPEYAHGIPGSLKNALDWLVSTNVLENKPVGIITGSTSSGIFAHEALEEVLRTMSAKVIPEASITLGGIQTQIFELSFKEDLRRFVDSLIAGSVLKS